jgi:hypothetical protein
MEPTPDKEIKWLKSVPAPIVPGPEEANCREFRILCATDRGDLVLYKLTEQVHKGPKAVKN